MEEIKKRRKFNGVGFHGESNCEPAPLKIKRKSRSGPNHGESNSKAQETNNIRELYRAICEFQEKPSETELRKKQGIETEWEFPEESRKVNSADRIDQLNSSRFKTQMGSKNLSRKAMKFRKMKCLVWGGNPESRNLQQIRRCRLGS